MFRNHVMHGVFVKDGRNRITEDMIVDVAAYEDLVACVYPFLEFCFEVAHEGVSRVGVILDRLEVSVVLRPNREIAIFARARLVQADNSEDDAPFASISCPGPSSKIGFIAACSHDKPTELALGKDAGTSCLALGVRLVIFVMREVRGGGPRLKGVVDACLPVVSSANPRPIETDFLEKGHIN